MIKFSMVLLLISSLLTISSELKAQSNISIAATGLGFDFGDGENAAIYKQKAGNGKSPILEPGIRIGLEVYASPATSLKFVQTLRFDEMQKLALSSQVMLRFKIFKIYKHSLSIGVGPTVFLRQTWQNEEGYIDEGVYKSGSWQNKVCWLSAELEYNYVVSKYNDVSFAVCHLNPESMGFAIGLKHWFSRKSNKCNTCPSFK